MTLSHSLQNGGGYPRDSSIPSGWRNNSVGLLWFLGITRRRAELVLSSGHKTEKRNRIVAIALNSGGVAMDSAIKCEDDDAPVVTSLAALRRAENECRRCPLYRNATQAVPGQGPRRASMMLVGEQPGDKEDLAGLPFVGPAGRVLDGALAEAGIDRKRVFVTNAVKHFKHEMRGKRRLHKRPNAHEIDRCHWWQDLERAIVKPEVIVALGATAARSVLGRPTTIGKVRGQALTLEDGATAFVTVHPSALLRIKDADDKRRQYRSFVDDLRLASHALKI
jgi:uracil-DNA glycosylase family protein